MPTQNFAESTPQIISIESTVIASILFDSEAFSEIADVLSPSDFLLASHRKIFDVCKMLHSQGIPITPEFVLTRLEGTYFVSQAEFSEILATSPIANIQGYIAEIKDASIKRQLNSFARLIADKTSKSANKGTEILDEVEKGIYDISAQGTESSFRNSKEIVSSTLELIKERKERGNSILVGLNTGFQRLNRFTAGFKKGELIVLGARPAMGKTALCLSFVQTVLNSGKGAAIFSLEMPAEQLMFRIFASMADIAMQDLIVGKMNDKEMSEFTRVANAMSQKSLYIDDSSDLSIAQLRSKLRKLKSQDNNVEFAVIDYLQLMRGSGTRRGEGARQEEISEISRGLKTLARDLEIPILALSQLNRSLESRDDKRPMLSDLRESGAIEQDADIILFLYREFVYADRALKAKIAKAKQDGKSEEDIRKLEQERIEKRRENTIENAEIIIAKNRNGEVDEVRVQFNAPFMRFEDRASEREISYQPTNTKMDLPDDIETVKI